MCLVFRYDLVCKIENIFSGTVILFEVEYFHVFKILLELLQILHIRSTPRINALGKIADSSNMMIFLPQKSCQFILNQIGILKFIYHDITVHILIFSKNLWKFLKKPYHFKKQIVKIICLVFPKLLLILLVNFGNLRRLVVRKEFKITIGSNELVFRI